MGYSNYAKYSQGRTLTNVYRPDYNNGASADSSSHTFYNTKDYFCIEDAISQFGINPSSEIKNMVFGSSSDWSYFLASRCVIAYTSNVDFNLGLVGGGGYAYSGAWPLFGSVGISNFISAPVRPVVVLNSNVQIEQRAGTSGEPHHIL